MKKPERLFKNSPEWKLDFEGDWVCQIHKKLSVCIQIPGSGSMLLAMYACSISNSKEVESLEEAVEFIRDDLKKYLQELMDVIDISRPHFVDTSYLPQPEDKK